MKDRVKNWMQVGMEAGLIMISSDEEDEDCVVDERKTTESTKQQFCTGKKGYN